MTLYRFWPARCDCEVPGVFRICFYIMSILIQFHLVASRAFLLALMTYAERVTSAANSNCASRQVPATHSRLRGVFARSWLQICDCRISMSRRMCKLAGLLRERRAFRLKCFGVACSSSAVLIVAVCEDIECIVDTIQKALLCIHF